jgi:hypothetical protein
MQIKAKKIGFQMAPFTSPGGERRPVLWPAEGAGRRFENGPQGTENGKKMQKRY